MCTRHNTHCPLLHDLSLPVLSGIQTILPSKENQTGNHGAATAANVRYMFVLFSSVINLFAPLGQGGNGRQVLRVNASPR
jgi:hypothetical protein